MENRFELTPKELKLAEEFKKRHEHKDINKGAIGGHISYTFTPNGIFRGAHITCSICGEKENITDYSCW